MAASNEEFLISQTGFSNGISDNMADKTWLPDSCRFSRNLAIFDNLNYVTLNPQPIRDDGGTVTDFVRWMDAAYPFENARYAYGGSGNVYHIDIGNNWTLDQTLSNSQGNGMAQLGNAMYFATNDNIVAKQNLSGTSVYNTTQFGTGLSNPVNIDINVNASGNTYTTPTSIIEDSQDSLLFGGLTNGYNTLAYDPLDSIALKVGSIGTGNWTVTFHDTYNNNLGSATIANASMTTGPVEFDLSAVSILIGAPYHAHVTTTTGDGTVVTTASSDLSTAWVQTFYGILIDTQYHPMMQFQNGVSATWCVGNDSYIGVYDGVVYNPNKIRLRPGFSVRIFVKINQNIVAFCTKGTDLQTYEYGEQFVWDGIQPYYTLNLPLTQGMPNAAINFKNRLFGIYGINGDIDIAPDETQPFKQVQQAPKLTKGYPQTTEPGAIAIWQKRALFSYAGTSDPNAGQYIDPSAGNHISGDTYTPPVGLEPGIYEFGNQSDRDITWTAVSTEVLNFAYQPSQTIINPDNFAVGCIMPFGNDVYISYGDNEESVYVDRINKLNGACTFGSWESQIEDHSIDKYGQLKNMPQKKKRGLRVRVVFDTLPTGCTITAKYRLERATDWIFGPSTVAGDHLAYANIEGIAGVNYREIEYGFDVTSTNGNYPKITFVGLVFKPETQETILGSNL